MRTLCEAGKKRAEGLTDPKWHPQVAVKPAIKPHHTRLPLSCDPMGSLQIIGPNTAGQSVFGVVGRRDHLLLRGEAVHRGDGPKDFLHAACVCAVQSANQRRLEEGALIEGRGEVRRPLAAAQNLPAVLDGQRHERLDLGAVLQRRHGAKLARARIAALELRVGESTEMRAEPSAKTDAVRNVVLC